MRAAAFVSKACALSLHFSKVNWGPLAGQRYLASAPSHLVFVVFAFVYVVTNNKVAATDLHGRRGGGGVRREDRGTMWGRRRMVPPKQNNEKKTLLSSFRLSFQ